MTTPLIDTGNAALKEGRWQAAADAFRGEMVDIATSSHLEYNLDNPLAPFLFTASTMHCTTVSLAQGGEGLGACWGEEKARELLAEAGFSTVVVERVEGDPVNAYYVCQ